MKKTFIFSLFILFCIQSRPQSADSLTFSSLDPARFRQAMNSASNPILIDVREYFEFRKSRIKGSVNIPASGSIEASADTLDKSASLFFYCTSGFRSKRAAKNLAAKGFTLLYSLDGGINAWKKEGFPVDRKRIRRKVPH